MKRAALALAALTTATLALAQQATPPPNTAEPPKSTTAQSNSSARSTSEADKQTQTKNCVKQTHAERPGATQQDVKEYCDKVVKSSSAPR